MNPDFLPTDDDGLLAAGRRAFRELPDAPEWMILRAEALGAPRAASQPSLLKRLQALLRVDSWAGGAVPVLRGAAGTRQLLFNAGEYDVDLRVVAAGEGWAMEGQVLGPDEPALVQLSAEDGKTLALQPLDELGAFRIAGLAAGRYRLELRLAAAVVELPPVEVGAAASLG